MRSRSAYAAVVSACVLLLVAAVSAAISIPTEAPYGQGFDAIGTSATATLPADFRLDRPSTVRTVGNYATALTATSTVAGSSLPIWTAWR